MRGHTLLVILKMLWLKMLHPKATLYVVINNTNLMEKDIESHGWWVDRTTFVDYKYGTICIEHNYQI